MHIDQTERRYIIFALLLVGAFGIAIAISSSAYSINVVRPESQIDPKLLTTPGATAYDGFAEPPENRLRELSPGRYEAYIIGYATKGWIWEPEELRVPAGSEVTFYVTSADVTHGFIIQNTNVNMMVLPGQVSKLTTTFDTPGTYNFICHEYCGILHHNMYGQLIVE
ncbi:MAG: cytochrome c oxidase subunit II [Ardenticatenaceae bacterium]|nr:cytochrome c oxidase subunit II [Ardenticatenaceae bacterium]